MQCLRKPKKGLKKGLNFPVSAKIKKGLKKGLTRPFLAFYKKAKKGLKSTLSGEKCFRPLNVIKFP